VPAGLLYGADTNLAYMTRPGKRFAAPPLAEGADVNKAGARGDTAILLGSEVGEADVAALLFSKRDDPNLMMALLRSRGLH
jgi:hypothetical protein